MLCVETKTRKKKITKISQRPSPHALCRNCYLVLPISPGQCSLISWQIFVCSKTNRKQEKVLECNYTIPLHRSSAHTFHSQRLMNINNDRTAILGIGDYRSRTDWLFPIGVPRTKTAQILRSPICPECDPKCELFFPILWRGETNRNREPIVCGGRRVFYGPLGVIGFGNLMSNRNPTVSMGKTRTR